MVDQESTKQKLLTKEESSNNPQKEMRLFLRLLIAFERNYQHLLMEANENVTKDVEFVSRIPGYRKLQIVFLYYLRRLGVGNALLLTLLFPLPHTLLFYCLSQVLQRWVFSSEVEIVLIGLRCSVVSYLCRYCLHFPEGRLNWIIYVGSIVCAVISNNNYTFIIIYVLTIILSYFRSQDVRNRSSLAREEEEFRIEVEALKKLDTPIIPNGKWYVVAIGVFFVTCWITQRIYVHSHSHYHLVELFLIGLLGTNQEMATFFPGLYAHLSHNVPTANLYALGYLLPGLHLKTFFLLFGSEDWAFLFLSYLALHLPSILLLCAALAYRQFFFSVTWVKISASIQSASNGLVLVAVGTMLMEESCHLHIAFFTSLVIFTVTKLYKFNEIISAMLGVFLVASRAAVLHFNNKKTLNDFLCKGK